MVCTSYDERRSTGGVGHLSSPTKPSLIISCEFLRLLWQGKNFAVTTIKVYWSMLTVLCYSVLMLSTDEEVFVVILCLQTEETTKNMDVVSWNVNVFQCFSGPESEDLLCPVTWFISPRT